MKKKLERRRKPKKPKVSGKTGEGEKKSVSQK
jgi:hypothetical protein